MNQQNNQAELPAPKAVRIERTFQRFTLGQRWEHVLLLASFSALLLTGLPQKYRAAAWSQQILSTPERLETIQQIHHIAAIVLTAEVIYHLGRAIYLLFRRRLPGEMLPTWQDVLDAWQMFKYLLFISKEKPAFGKYNFEQKVTYWFLFFGIGIMVMTGLIIWFPVAATRVLPGGVVPAAKLAHSTEAIMAGIFVVIWHIYHVHIERLNLSIFTGRLSEHEMRTYHSAEYERLTGEKTAATETGGSQ
ncbi:MAG: cytochrome b/b6 domain-containing protein [Anaerolineales bacterium]|nr:cytochrome b/b6 domain-containing protein [Anaerolineales bacterium]